MDLDQYSRKEYSKGTERLMGHIENHWRCYLNQKMGKRGKKRPIKKRSSLVTIWCTFRLVFEQTMNCKIDEKIHRNQMTNAFVELGNKLDLTYKKRMNRAMTLEDLKLKDPTAKGEAALKLLIRLSLEYTKSYLGPKAANTFLIPEIIYDPSLLLSPYIFLLAILFRHRVFKSEALNNAPHLLSTLKVPENCFEMPLGFKKEVKSQYVFR
ncbi:hypothetical protein F5Y18DRAFT_432325 [Xylariaceae sp. FL1019]|nr:hypothetical protein F5Y18DRAFT_432325 [Xylariaceae sp. FL1019]